MEQARNLSISGMGTVPSGKYGHIGISGTASVNGPVEADSMEVNGLGFLHGPLKVGTVSVNGSASLSGTVVAETLTNSGRTRIKDAAAVSISDLFNNGAFHCSGNLRSDTIRSNGYMKVDGDVEAEELELSGAIRVKGLLNANRISLMLNGSSRAAEIGGEHIHIVRQENTRSWLLSLLLSWVSHSFKADLIEGTDIFLEETEAKMVRGSRVTIGRNCRIGTVEYTQELTVEPGSEIRQTIKIENKL